LAPRRKLPADLLGHRQGITEALRESHRWHNSGDALAPKDKGAMEQEHVSLAKAGTPGMSGSWRERPLYHKQTHM
jgi:hypothetical protein